MRKILQIWFVCWRLRRGGQFEKILDENFGDIEVKYGPGSVLKKIPLVNKNCNAFVSKNELSFKKHFLKNGMKKLLYEIELPNGSNLVFAHFSLNSGVRKKQFREVNKMFDGSRVVCGDFNIFQGLEELKPLTENSLKLVDDSPTFPSSSPIKSLDLFLCSSDLDCEVEVLDSVLSDHSPVLLTTKLSSDQ